MDDDTQNYYITPPTLFLPEQGIRISTVGTDLEWIETLSDDLENTFPTVPMTFYHLDQASADNWQWLYYMMDSSDLIMVNVAQATSMEINLCFLKYSPKFWFHVDNDQVDKELRILLNTVNANVYNDTEQLHAMLRNYVGE
jgi:hypothetical protein